MGERDLLKISRESNNKTLSSSRSGEKNCAERTFGLGYLSLSLVFVYASLVGFGLILYSKYVRMSTLEIWNFLRAGRKKMDESSSLCDNLGLHTKKQKNIVLNSLFASICRSYHEKSIASHQHSEIKPHWAPIVLRLVIT